MDAIISTKSFKKVSQENKSTLKTRFIIAIVVIASNQLSGTNAILYYAKQLFNKITDNDIDKSQLLIIGMSFVQVLATLLSGGLVDKLGRKKIILGGQAGIVLCLFIIFMFDKLISEWLGPGIANVGVIFFIFVHLVFQNVTLGPCCIVYCT